MPCPPHPIEQLESRCGSSARNCASQSSAWDQLLSHAETLLSLVNPPPKGARGLLKARLPGQPPAIPSYNRKKQSLGDYGDALDNWLTRAVKVEKAYADRLCKVRTLVVRLGDEISDWPFGVDHQHQEIKGTHLYHRRQDRKQFIKNLRWSLKLDEDLSPEGAQEIEAQIQRLEAMDDEALVRWNPDEE